MTFTSAGDAISERFEPGASPSSERFATLEAFKAKGIPTGILAMPLLPGICDSSQALQSLYDRALEAGVDFIMPGGLTLRPGRQKDYYLSVLRDFAPELEPLYQEAYAEERPSGAPLSRVSRELHRRTSPIQAVSGLPWFVPHAVLRRIVPEYEALHLLFCQMKENYQSRGIVTQALEQAATRYAEWLQEARRGFNRQRSLPGDWIERQFLARLASSAWEDLLGNAKLAAFSREVIGGRNFDHRTLKLV
jgi:DNA repair photolyase